jgi:hypothetical protein
MDWAMFWAIFFSDSSGHPRRVCKLKGKQGEDAAALKNEFQTQSWPIRVALGTATAAAFFASRTHPIRTHEIGFDSFRVVELPA